MTARDKTPTIALALLTAALTACGLGTEIGNGAKPSGGDDTKTPAVGGDAANSAAGDGAQPTTAKDQKGDGSDTTQTTKSDGGNAGSSADKAASAAVPAAAEAQNALLAPCGTPFAAAYVTPLKLVQNGPDGKEVVHFDATYQAGLATWTVTPSNGAPAMAVTAMPSSTTSAASVRNVGTSQLVDTDAYACTSYTKTLNSTLPGTTTSVTKVSVILAPKGTVAAAPTTLVWYILPGAGKPDTLLRVDLQTSGTTQTLLNAP